MRRDDAAALGLLALVLACLLWRLGSVPALTLDEAWIGLFARRLAESGLYTPHQMNHYTGALYASGVAAVFSRLGTSVTALRLLGACLNAAAFAGLWAHLRRRVSPEAGAAWAALAAGSAYLLLKSRLAWEVYALHPALVLGTLALVADPRGGAWRGAALAALTVLGAQNHFIYLCVPAGLAALFGARAAWQDEAEARAPFRWSLGALAAGAAFAALKHPLSDASWQAHRAAWAAALVAAPAFAAWAAPDRLALVLIEHFRRPLRVLVGLGLLAFAVWHLAPLVQLLSGPVVLKRVFAWPPPLWLSAAWHLWGAFLAALLPWFGVRAWSDRALPFHERTLLLLPVAVAAVFIAFRYTSSLRYYSLPVTLSLVALAVALPRLAAPDKRLVYPAALLAALATQAVVLRELASPGDRRPLTFKIGWRTENSKDFSRKDALFEAFDASGACGVAHAERSFTAIPLFFHRAAAPRACDAALSFDADQCPDCPSAPYYRWAVTKAPTN